MNKFDEVSSIIMRLEFLYKRLDNASDSVLILNTIKLLKSYQECISEVP